MTRNFNRLRTPLDRRYAEILDDRYPDIVDILVQELADGATPDELGVFLREVYGAEDYFVKQMVAAARHLAGMKK